LITILERLPMRVAGHHFSAVKDITFGSKK